MRFARQAIGFIPHALLLAGLAATAAAQAQSQSTIKRWVDERGIVHYGDAVPAQQAHATRVTDITPAAAPSAEAQARARARLQQYRDQLTPTAAPPVPSAPASAAAGPTGPTGPIASDSSCLAQWQRYNAAYACLDGHRLAGGGVRAEAAQQCPQVAQPSCPAPESVLVH